MVVVVVLVVVVVVVVVVIVTTLLVVIGKYEKEYLLRNLGQTVHLVQSFIC